jgi:molybdopterin-guanine dinucleotide biosynthesis protein A
VTTPAGFDALVLAGGAGSRMGTGTAKIDLEVGGSTLLERALAAVDGAGVIVVVGPRRPVGRDVIFTSEEPAGSGPAAAIVHGLPFVAADIVVVLAADVPFAHTAVPKLLEALHDPAADAAMLTDDTGRRQPLIAAYRVASLRRVAADRDWAGQSVHSLVRALGTRDIDAAGAEAFDCDTPAELDAARGIVSGSASG